MIKNLTFNKSLFLITGSLALIAALWGVLDPDMYEPVVGARQIPGVFTQDLIVILAALVMIFLSIRMKEDDYRRAIVIFGVLGFLFYAYGIYAIEQVYTPLYLLYLAILALSFFVPAYSLVSLEHPPIEALTLPPAIRYIAAGYGIFIAVMFNFIWISALIPLIQTHDRIENAFSVFIIDLVFIMPAFVILAILLIRNHALGIVGIPAMFILGVGILSPLALAELLSPVRYGRPMIINELLLYGTLSSVFLIFAAVYLIALKPAKRMGK